ncbi:unnamed protein product [Gongylonema pulchrum]|uniref:ARF7EP_C domain-containing protein n=1 Tax=Gongylonema pulchrum TaxID=637853 RepID=A0A183DKQ8_9BILA|nr:unnamed protein product [Gongylonema pulchrum]
MSRLLCRSCCVGNCSGGSCFGRDCCGGAAHNLSRVTGSYVRKRREVNLLRRRSEETRSEFVEEKEERDESYLPHS